MTHIPFMNILSLFGLIALRSHVKIWAPLTAARLKDIRTYSVRDKFCKKPVQK